MEVIPIYVGGGGGGGGGGEQSLTYDDFNFKTMWLL